MFKAVIKRSKLFCFQVVTILLILFTISDIFLDTPKKKPCQDARNPEKLSNPIAEAVIRRYSVNVLKNFYIHIFKNTSGCCFWVERVWRMKFLTITSKWTHVISFKVISVTIPELLNKVYLGEANILPSRSIHVQSSHQYSLN